ncbi:AbrB/MazE/SpoVT family DNA-binding domain-containing protein [Lactiplantibacillus herbarum]|uniref:AbrB/MazE/SpoVT family DNA-binding domain-containing protein n=1 Tax=Lactiplantibacillus herbarum TaxID=1670446 RepID=UPI00064E39BF|nr:hypothetical protein [Lactiplantibacillus herbarum]
MENEREQLTEQRKVFSIGGSLVVTIPRKMAEKMQLEKGNQVKINMSSDGKLTLEKETDTSLSPTFQSALEHAMDKYADALKMLKEYNK